MSPAPQPPGRSPPGSAPLRSHSPRPVILPPGPRTSRSFALAAARLRALHLDPHRPRRRRAITAGTMNDSLASSPRLHREWASAGELRRAVSSRVRRDLDDALDALVLSGDIEAEATEYHGQPGTRYRLRG